VAWFFFNWAASRSNSPLEIAWLPTSCRPRPKSSCVGLGGFQQGAFDFAVQLQERLAGLDLLPRFELQLLHRAGDLQAQVNALQGLQAADGGQARLPGLLGGLGHGNADGRFRDRKHLDLLVDGEGLVACQQQHHQQDNTQHDQHAASQHVPLPLEKS
jgi:hypothetical protein